MNNIYNNMYEALNKNNATGQYNHSVCIPFQNN